MTVDRRNFLVFGSAGLVALGMTKAAVAELPAMLRGRTISSSPAKAVFARAFNRWMDEAVRHEQEWSHECDDVALFRKQLSLGIKPTHGSGAAAHLFEYMDLGNASILPIAATKHDGAAVTPAEAVFGRLSTCGCMKPSAIPRAGLMRRVMSLHFESSQPWALSRVTEFGLRKICCIFWSRLR